MTGQHIGHYRVVRKLGEGGMGTVHLADDTRLDRQVAIKLLPGEMADDADRRQRFLAEAKAASALNHPNVCVIHEVGETDEGCPFIVMEFLEGEPLDEVIGEVPLETSRVVDLARQMADAMDVAHGKGIVHRDIKPANVMVNDRGQVKVLDFGLAKRRVSEESADPCGATGPLQTQAGTVMGTPGYMSPEQALGKEVDHRSDLFSFGVVLYQLVTGRQPFLGRSLGETLNNIVHAQPFAMAKLNYDLPAELERITLKCLQKAADRRYQSARELLIDLKSLRQSLETGDVAPNASRPDERPPSVGEPDATPPPGEPPTPEKVAQSDVFISSARIDDEPLWPEAEGWISQFERNLRVRLEQLLGEPINISSCPMPAGESSAHETLIQTLPSAKTLVSVLSPPFTKSEGCRRSVEQFWHSAEESGRLWVENRSRLFKVVKTAVSPIDVPPELAKPFSQVLSFDFFEEDASTGRVREFDERFGPEARQRYFERIYDVAHEICRVLTALKQDRSRQAEEPGERTGKVVFLATTSSDLQADVDRIRRELIGRGHEVLPDRPLPLVGSELEAVVREYLARSDLAVHPIGSLYGIIPEGTDRSIVELQNRIAAELAGESPLERVIWMPRDLQPRDGKQEALVRAIKEDDALHRGADVVQNNLETLKQIVIDKLAPRKQPEDPGPSPGAGSTPRVYLICDKNDESAVEPVEDYLFEQGFEVSLPDFEAAEAEAAEIHRENLLDCDAVLIFYGSARHSWVDIKLRNVIKASGYSRAAEIQTQAVYVAPPFDRRKDRFRSHVADVIRQADRFDPALLQGFVEQLKQTGKGMNE